MLIICPVFGSIATSPALYALKFFSFSADLVRNKSSNFSCHCQLMVVVTFRPPRSTISSPYFSTRYSLTKREKCGAFIPLTAFTFHFIFFFFFFLFSFITSPKKKPPHIEFYLPPQKKKKKNERKKKKKNKIAG